MTSFLQVYNKHAVLLMPHAAHAPGSAHCMARPQIAEG